MPAITLPADFIESALRLSGANIVDSRLKDLASDNALRYLEVSVTGDDVVIASINRYSIAAISLDVEASALGLTTGRTIWHVSEETLKRLYSKGSPLTMDVDIRRGNPGLILDGEAVDVEVHGVPNWFQLVPRITDRESSQFTTAGGQQIMPSDMWRMNPVYLAALLATVPRPRKAAERDAMDFTFSMSQSKPMVITGTQPTGIQWLGVIMPRIVREHGEAVYRPDVLDESMLPFFTESVQMGVLRNSRAETRVAG